MQLHRIVEFHKTMGDKTRLQLIALLRDGPLHGQALAEKLGVTPPTISYHITKLREIDLIYQRRDKNTIYFYLNEEKLHRLAQAILELGASEFQDDAPDEQEKLFVLRQFFDEDDKLKQLPKQDRKKRIVLAYLAKQLEMGKFYSEEEMNQFLLRFHEDTATIRRAFIMYHIMYRQDGMYSLNPQEIWE